MIAVGKKLLIKVDPPKELTDGGIVVTGQDPENRGTVVSFGAAVHGFKEGYRVIFRFPTRIDDDHVVVEEDDILAVL